MMVVIVDDPDIGPIDESNLIARSGDSPCQHLLGSQPGEYACAVHDREWYGETPCFSHTQIENSPDDPCRMGVFILNLKGESYEQEDQIRNHSDR